MRLGRQRLSQLVVAAVVGVSAIAGAYRAASAQGGPAPTSLVVAPAQGGPAPTSLVVAPGTALTSLTEAIRRSTAGGRILVRRGTYREALITVDRPLTIVGEPGAILDGSGAHTIMVVTANDVTVRALTFRHTGPSQSDERAGVRVQDADRCRIEENRFDETLFAIYLAKTSGCLVSRNIVRGAGTAQSVSGSGIHVWSSDNVELAYNDVRGHRDGIYFEFVKGSRVHDNQSAESARYGMHFMFSDDCTYERNIFRDNSNGVAVMYSKRVTIEGNQFVHNWGSAAYGLLLKDISDSHVIGNDFINNSTGLYLEDANRNVVRRNVFRENGWALKVMANAQGNEVEANDFEANAFDVATNSRANYSRFSGNFWDRYRGYDLNHDGIGDVPHSPVRLFALVVGQSPPTLILLRSLLVDFLDMAERIVPSLTPETLVDDRPLMRRPLVGAPHD